MKKQAPVILCGLVVLLVLVWVIDHYLNLKALVSFRDALLTFLEIISLFLLIIVLVTVVRWLLLQPDGTAILPFEIVTTGDSKQLSNYDGKSVADSLAADMIMILNIHKLGTKDSEKHEGAANIDQQLNATQDSEQKIKGRFTNSAFSSTGEKLNADFADIANVTVSGNSISIGRLLLTLKKLWNDREPKYIISGSLQKYGNMIRLISKLKTRGEETVVCEVHKTIESEAEIPELIRDLSYKIWQEIPSTWKDISGTVSKTWLGLKHFTESLACYEQYKSSKSAEYLYNAVGNCIKASQEESGYQNLYALAYNLGAETFNIKDFEKAQELFRCAGNIAYDGYGPSSPEFIIRAGDAYMGYGLSHWNLGHLAFAEFSFRKVLELKPTDTDGYYHLSMVLADLSRPDEAMGIYLNAIEKKLINEDDYAMKGKWLNDMGLKPEAIAEYEKAIKKDDKNASLYNERAKIYLDLKSYEEALADFGRVITLKPDFKEADGNPHHYIGYIYTTMIPGDEEKAITEMKMAMHLNPALALPHFNLGVTYFFSERKYIYEAISELNRATQLDSEYSEAFNMLGIAYNEFGDLENGFINLKKAIELSPRSPEYHNDLARAYFNNDEFENSEQEYKTALSLDPENHDSHNGLGFLYRYLKEYPKAISAFRHAARFNPGFESDFSGIGEIFRRLNNWDEAIESYQEAIRINPDDAVYRLCLAVCYREKGDLVNYELAKDEAIEVRKDWQGNDYSLACYESLFGNVNGAIGFLRNAFEKKSQTPKYAGEDIDLDPIREEPSYRRLLEEFTAY